MPRTLPPIVRIKNGTFYRHHPSIFSSPSSSSPSSLASSSHHHHLNPPLFPNLSFELPARGQTWCIVGPSLAGKTTFLEVLRGRHLCLPPLARTFPLLGATSDDGGTGEPPLVPHRNRTPHRALQMVGFDDRVGGRSHTTSAYLSARYESRREKDDFSLRDWLLGNTQLNPFDDGTFASSSQDALAEQAFFDSVVSDLSLTSLLSLPVSFLSNGQGRRARVARALLSKPEALLLDEPFMGLDPPTVARLAALLWQRLLADDAEGLQEAERRGKDESHRPPTLVLASRPQDPLPPWVTHLMVLGGRCEVAAAGPKDEVLDRLESYVAAVRAGRQKEDERLLPLSTVAHMGRELGADGEKGLALGDRGVGGFAGVNVPAAADGEHVAAMESPRLERGEPLVEMDGVAVRYGDKIALGSWSQQTETGAQKDGLVWTVRRGERWGVFGPNGSGKTTVVSLICSDHPQTYSLPIRLFGQSRLPEPGSGVRPLTFWDIQARIGHSSPEIHQHMPRTLTVRQVVANAWADTFRSRPRLDDVARQKVDACLRWFEQDLNPAAPRSGTDAAISRQDTSWADEYVFGELSFSAQRVALFLRAVVKAPDIVVLDEAFSGMDDAVRDRCLLFLHHGETRAVDAKEDVITEDDVARSNEVRITGLSDHQALICISHVREEVPDCIRQWLCLPEANTGQPARTGILDGPLAENERRWREIWGYV